MPRHFDASVGGRVDAGESYDQTVVREAKEELGIDIHPKFVMKYFMDVPKKYKFVSVYYAFHEGPFTGWKKEADAIEWLPFDEAFKMMEKFPYLFCDTTSLKKIYETIIS